jgi:uncharacterized HhH-GPD family protein
MPAQLYFTDSPEANRLLAKDPLALLIGFALDQQVTVQKAFMGPFVLRERLGSLEAEAVAAADLGPIFAAKPAIHRFPGTMAGRVHDLAVHVCDDYGGEAKRVWSGVRSSEKLEANILALPGFGRMKADSLAAVLAKRFNVKAAAPLVPDHPTLGDVDSLEALAEYQAAKRAYKASLKSKAR